VREVRALGSKVRALGSKIRKKNFLFFFTQEMLARVLEVAKARCKQIWAPVKENDADIPQLESAELVAASARALTAAKEFAKATASAAVAATKSRDTKPKPVKRKGEPRGHYSRKPKALKVEFRQIFYAHGVEEAVASMADKGVPESTARGWADPKELAKPLPVDGKNRPGAGRAPAYSLEQLRPVYDKASERKHLVGRVDDRYLRRVCKTDLPTVDGYDMQFTRPYLRGKAKAFGFSFGETTPAKPSDIVKDPETVRRELYKMFAEAFQWRLEYFTKHYPGSALSLEPMCTGNRLFYFDELGQSLEAGAGPLTNTMFRKDETNEEGEREPGKSGSGRWRTFYTLGVITNAHGGVELFLVAFVGKLQLSHSLIEVDGHLIFVAWNDTHYNNNIVFEEFLRVALALIVERYGGPGSCGWQDPNCQSYCWVDDNATCTISTCP
jgi:hypothetical protein